MAATVWKGYTWLRAHTIPVRLFAAARTERVSFNQIHQPCGAASQQIFCPQCDRIAERNELVKGYEVEKDRYVIVKDEEIKEIAPPSSDTMEIMEFVKAEGIDPIYFDASYFMAPEDAGEKRITCCSRRCASPAYSAIAKIAMHQASSLWLYVRMHKGSCCIPCSTRKKCGRFRSSSRTELSP